MNSISIGFPVAEFSLISSPMVDAKSKARIARLQTSGFRQDDLTGLFLFARDHCDGRETVRDIGDFVAHHNERDRGIITRSVQDWFTVARFHLGQFRPNQPKLDFDPAKMPASTRDYFKIAATRIDQKIFKTKANVNRASAHKILTEIASRMNQNPDGTWQIPFLSKSEIGVINAAISVIVVRPAFDDERLVEDFFSTLRSNGLITKDELREHRTSLATLVKLYAVSAMHNTVVQIGDGTTCRLKGRIASISEIGVSATVPDAFSTPNINVATDIFVANVPVADTCHPELLNRSDWDFELEVAPDRRLTPLR